MHGDAADEFFLVDTFWNRDARPRKGIVEFGLDVGFQRSRIWRCHIALLNLATNDAAQAVDTAPGHRLRFVTGRKTIR
ncbi:hypothetical protein EB75_22220 [Mycobacterium sp. ST-F2]|nr:hypothetical protein EB75_22220 [Mycobacterium sp. ST-F2]